MEGGRCIPSSRLNAGKSIGIPVYDPEEKGYVQEYQFLNGRTMDIDILQIMYFIRMRLCRRKIPIDLEDRGI